MPHLLKVYIQTKGLLLALPNQIQLLIATHFTAVIDGLQVALHLHFHGQVPSALSRRRLWNSNSHLLLLLLGFSQCKNCCIWWAIAYCI